MTAIQNPVQCARCRNVHPHSARVSQPRPLRLHTVIGISDLVCPRCGAKSFYDLQPQVAWCWASGLIEIGDALPPEGPGGSGAILIARGPKANLKMALEVLARHGQGRSAGSLLVPGVPEAVDQQAKGDALADWLRWCSKPSTANRGVTFFTEGAHA